MRVSALEFVSPRDSARVAAVSDTRVVGCDRFAVSGMSFEALSSSGFAPERPRGDRLRLLQLFY